jgi:hypothetical protein
MSESFVAAHTQSIWPDALNVILDLIGDYTLYLDVGGTTKEVKRLHSSPNGLVMVVAPGTAGDLDWDVEVLAYGFKDSQQLHIYGIKAAPTTTGKLYSGKVG